MGDLSPERRFIMHFPEENLVWSVGSGYGGNALLGKKCFGLRIASWQGLREGWLAEHMIIIGVEDPRGKVTYLAAAFPSGSGKTNLAMLEPALPGYRVWTIGDDIAWMRMGEDGRLYAMNPEYGFFGIAPGTSFKTNPNMMRTIGPVRSIPLCSPIRPLMRKRTNRGGRGWANPRRGSSTGRETRGFRDQETAAHPNSRFTASISQCPSLSPEYENPRGVPISAILFGSRRSRTLPLVLQSTNWAQGVFMGAIMGAETTAAATGKVGVLRRDPMAMLPFCGYHMGDYFGHWLGMGQKLSRAPKIFFVNWFRTDESGKFLWPGFGENIRVLKWIIEQTEETCARGARETCIGFVPSEGDLDVSGLSIPAPDFRRLCTVDREEWAAEFIAARDFLTQFGGRLPGGILRELEEMGRRCGNSWAA